MAELAHRFGTEVGMPKCAKAAGLLHDFGKYSEAFQNVLNGTAAGVDHAVCAAAYLYGSVKTAKPAYRMIAEATAAHHSALRSFESMATELRDICRGEGSGVCWPGKKSALFGPGQFIEAQRAFARDFSGFKLSAEHFDDTSAAVKMLRERMLFSCLVDADYTASSGRSAYDSAALEPRALLSRLYDHMDELRKGSGSDKALNRIRDEVFQRCGEAGDMPSGLFTLTAPTGVGKTMALLHFALRHCLAQGKRRIILVLPFLTLTEQSQREYGKLIEHILSDHSQSRLSDEERELAGRWDSPFIITTSVRFFESLFSAHPKDCRKLHNIAQSVILFDEAQSLPIDLATATVRAARALLEECRTELQAEGKACAGHIPLGVMIETPASALIADLLARESDFFSIGTNDLTQYTMAVDRGNARVAGLYTTFHPAVLRSIRQVIAAGRAAGIPVGMCGESAADPALIPLLLAFGLDEFSVSPASVLSTRKHIAGWTRQAAEQAARDIAGWTRQAAEQAARDAMSLPTAAQVEACLRTTQGH